MLASFPTPSSFGQIRVLLSFLRAAVLRVVSFYKTHALTPELWSQPLECLSLPVRLLACHLQDTKLKQVTLCDVLLDLSFEL